MTNMDAYNRALQLVLIMLKGNQSLTADLIRDKTLLVLQMLKAEGSTETVDPETLAKDIESRCNVWIQEGTILESQEDHVLWLPDRRSRIDWKLWERYRRYLEEEECLPEKSILRLDDITDRVLERLEDPSRPGAWDRRGMVVGQIQSGKTANYIGLICKAADAGYKLIVVLAGLHKNLRSQTQLRIDEGFLGFDTQLSRAFNQVNLRMGVGSLPGAEFITVHSLTSSADNGDFNRRVADQVGVLPGGADPVILVVKKNKSVLQHLIRWSLSVRGEADPCSGKTLVRRIPLLLIDDEADNASINTNPVFDEDLDPSAINGLIRRLLDSFEQSACVGYTATPFANIFIYPEGETERHGEDLFPRSFIINLPSPSNYIGPAQFFGLDPDEDVGITGQAPLPLVMLVDDYGDFLPDGHKKDCQPGELPGSMRTAMRCFVLSCAARMARGQVKTHNSMLIHVTRYVDVQTIVKERIFEELTHLRRRIQWGDGSAKSNILNDLESLWETQYPETTRRVAQMIDDPLITPVSWSAVKQNLLEAVSKIEVRHINGTAKDVLDYRDHKNGLFTIAIGGDKLSRGLTLEGLTVSYYLRASRMYDTLMQMGRWFGYRPGYLDLCRIFTTAELVEWYRYITLCSEELRQEFDYMASVGRTPADYGLRVRTHPSGLIITAVNKMRSGTEMQLSYQGQSSETTIFDKDLAVIQRNFGTVDRFITARGTHIKTPTGDLLWSNVPAVAIIELLREISIHRDCRKANRELLRNYIETQVRQGELVNWTVALVSRKGAQSPEQKRTVGGHEIGLTKRGQETPPDQQRYCLNKGRLLDPQDEMLDLTPEQKDEALEKTRQKPGRADVDRPSPEHIREVREKQNGLLLIYALDPKDVVQSKVPFMGLFFSFPQSNTAKSIRYKVNNKYWEEEFGRG